MSRNFDGSTQYLNASSAPLTAVPLTMACWFYSTSSTATQTLLALGVLGSVNNNFSILAAGAIGGDPVQALARESGNSAASSTTGYSINTWQHACGVFASTTDRRAYVNGGSEGTNAVVRIPLGINATYAGTFPDLSAKAFGRIAEAAIWNVALSASEVAVLARGVSPLRIRPGNLKAYWPLYGVGSPEPDYIGGFHMTLTAAPTQADHAPVMPAFAYAQGWQGTFGGVAGVTPALLAANMRGNFRNPSGGFING